MDSFRKEYLSSKRKKRTFTQVLYNDNNLPSSEENKRIKYSKKEQLKELKLSRYFESLIIGKDNWEDMNMEIIRQGKLLNSADIQDDIIIESTYENKKEESRISLWDENNIKSLLDYEKVFKI